MRHRFGGKIHVKTKNWCLYRPKALSHNLAPWKSCEGERSVVSTCHRWHRVRNCSESHGSELVTQFRFELRSSGPLFTVVFYSDVHCKNDGISPLLSKHQHTSAFALPQVHLPAPLPCSFFTQAEIYTPCAFRTHSSHVCYGTGTCYS